MESVDCILCEGAPVEPYAREQGYQAVRCVGCGLVFVSPRPSIEEMKALYEGQETKVDLYRHIASRDAKVAEALRALRTIQRYRQRGRLLEIGSAAGYFLWEAKRRGFDVQGLDITRQFVEFSERVLGVPAHEGTPRDAPFADSSFDVIYHRNVLSHLAWPATEFLTMARLLRPGGHLVFETGNVAELPLELAGDLELPDHLYHFSESTIRRLLDRTRFRCLEVRRHVLIDSLAPVRSVIRRFGSLRRNRTARSPAPVRALPDSLPASHARSRWTAEVNQFVRYDVGRLLPSTGHRCTLVIVAQRAG
jgi:SAM-dependent methyltransferase